MVIGRTNPHVSVANDGEIEGTRVEAFWGKFTDNGDHWSFLDEIEAPMWEDLISEATFTHQDKDDNWFYKAHEFHQSSSRKLKSLFSKSAEQPSSPNLPPSVSRSRGKHYKSNDWGQSKNHPVRKLGKSSWASSGTSSGAKPSLKNEKSNEPGSKTGSNCERCLIETSGIETSGSNFANSRLNLYSSTSNNLTSTSKSQAFGQTSGIVSTLKIRIRKSCVTRQASRVEKKVVRKSEGCKYPSDKSTAREKQNKEVTPDSRNVTRISQAQLQRGKTSTDASVGSSSNSSYISKNPTLEENPGGKNVTRTSQAPKMVPRGKNSCEASKPLNQVQRNFTVRPRGLVDRKVNQSEPLIATRGKMQVGIQKSNNKIFVIGKENLKGKIISSISDKHDDKVKIGGVERSLKQTLAQKNDAKKLVGPKEKANCHIGGKNRPTFVQKVYFR